MTFSSKILQNGYDRTKLAILSSIIFLFLLIFSSLYYIIAGPPLVPKNTPQFDQGKALKGKGLVLVSSGKYNESITYFDKALAINPNDVGALTSKGLALAKLGKYNESTTYFDKALEINPKFLVAIKEKEYFVASAGHISNSNNNNSTATKKP